MINVILEIYENRKGAYINRFKNYRYSDGFNIGGCNTYNTKGTLMDVI